jgi:hypothetical protein
MNLESDFKETKVYQMLFQDVNSTIMKELKNYTDVIFKENCKELILDELSIHLQEFNSKLIIAFGRTYNIEYHHDKLYYDFVCEAFENLLTKSLYNTLMQKCIEEFEDGKLERLIKKYSFINLKHLGLNHQMILDEFEFAKELKLLSEIGQSRSPKEKLNLITNFINYLNFKFSQNLDKAELVKFLVYSIFKCNIANFKAQIHYINLFRHKTLISSEEDYFVSLYFQAFEFIEKMNSSYIKMSKAEFDELCDEFEKKELLKRDKGNTMSSSKSILFFNIRRRPFIISFK